MKSDSSFERLIEVSCFKGFTLVVMGTTLYLLRQPPDRISSALFHAGDEETEVVFIEEAASMASSSVKGAVVAVEGVVAGHFHQTLTYDDLIEKIFLSERIVVV